MLDAHSYVIKELKNRGADKDSLWLVETQSIEEYNNFYGKELLEEREEDGIIYYHENGDVWFSATFKQDDKKSLDEDIDEMADYLS